MKLLRSITSGFIWFFFMSSPANSSEESSAHASKIEIPGLYCSIEKTPLVNSCRCLEFNTNKHFTYFVVKNGRTKGTEEMDFRTQSNRIFATNSRRGRVDNLNILIKSENEIEITGESKSIGFTLQKSFPEVCVGL